MGKNNSIHMNKDSFKFFVYFKIVMEYCGAGSVSDILKLRGKTVKKIYTKLI